MVRAGGWVETTGVDFTSSVISFHSKHSHFPSEDYSTVVVHLRTTVT